MCKRNSTGIDSVRNRRYTKSSVFLVLQCVLLVEAIILLALKLKTKTDEYENNEEVYKKNIKDLNFNIQKLSKSKEELENYNNNMENKKKQLNEEKELLSKQLRQIDGWKCYQSGLYYISSDKKNWAESKEDCLKRGAHLIIINNTAEKEFFQTVAGIWIGLTDSAVEGTWKWVDGSTLTSGFWASGQPNSNGGDQDCAILYPSGWYNYPCNDDFKWVCEKRNLK